VTESPGDLAVAFRSFGRRLDEAVRPLEDNPDAAAAVAETVQGLKGELRGILAQAASVLRGVTPTDDLTATGAAVGAAIAAVPPDAWEAGQLERLSALALDAGQLLRRVDSAVRAAT
jgi:hypothetical protein